MVEKQDFIACELTENVRLTEAQKQAAVQVLENIPFVPTERVTQLSVLLFMAVGFMNNVSAENRMMESGHSEELQGQITSYILELKQEEAPPPYPFEKEHVLLQCVARKDRDGARRLLNELLEMCIRDSLGAVRTDGRRSHSGAVLSFHLPPF